jgi:hypothetical protein
MASPGPIRKSRDIITGETDEKAKELAFSSFSSDLLVKVLAMARCRAAAPFRADIAVEVVPIPLLGRAGGFFPSLYSSWIF